MDSRTLKKILEINRRNNALEINTRAMNAFVRIHKRIRAEENEKREKPVISKHESFGDCRTSYADEEGY